jgi:hypothetical protein
MSNLSGIGLSSQRRLVRDDARSEHVVVQHPLRRVLAFRRRSIDDVVNNPIVKSEIFDISNHPHPSPLPGYRERG